MKADKINAPLCVSTIYLWAWAILFSFLSAKISIANLSFKYLLTDLLPLVSSIVVISFGPRRKLVLFAAFLLIISCFIQMPVMPNHRYVLLLSTFLLLMPILFSQAGSEDEYLKLKTLPAFRSFIVILYVYAAFVKLNYGYFDLENSCASIFTGHILSIYGFDSLNQETLNFIYNSAIYSSVILEFLLPLLFVIRFERVALMLGLIFHFILALDIYKYFTNFSSVMILLLITACGEDALRSLQREASSFIENVFKNKKNFIILFLLSLSLILTISLMYDLATAEEEKRKILTRFLVTRHIFWICYGGLMLSWVLRFVLTEGFFSRQRECVKTIVPSKRELCVLFLVFLNGLTPYLGLKSRTGFNMYSNMRLESVVSNHFIVPRNLAIGNYIIDSGIVLGSSDEMYCKGILYGRTEYPVFEILRAANSCPEENFQFEYLGKEYSSQSNEVLSMINHKTNWLERKFLTFKPLGLKAENECIW